MSTDLKSVPMIVTVLSDMLFRRETVQIPKKNEENIPPE